MIAYIDPGAGSFVLQAIIAAAAGAALAIKTWWKKIRAVFGLRGTPGSDPREGARPDDE
jgi:predicted RNA polymerase sigma factor